MCPSQGLDFDSFNEQKKVVPLKAVLSRKVIYDSPYKVFRPLTKAIKLAELHQ